MGKRIILLQPVFSPHEIKTLNYDAFESQIQVPHYSNPQQFHISYTSSPERKKKNLMWKQVFLITLQSDFRTTCPYRVTEILHSTLSQPHSLRCCSAKCAGLYSSVTQHPETTRDCFETLRALEALLTTAVLSKTSVMLMLECSVASTANGHHFGNEKAETKVYDTAQSSTK